jgi:hypothetical protein
MIRRVTLTLKTNWRRDIRQIRLAYEGGQGIRLSNRSAHSIRLSDKSAQTIF